MKKAVILVSGGMDSALTAAIACKKYHPAFLHINYGQRTQKRELKAFNDIADYYNVKDRFVADIGYLKKIGGSSLTDKNIRVSDTTILNEAAFSYLSGKNSKSKNIPSSYVPFRNANILAIAVSWAEVIKAEKIFIGAVEDDSSGYPDCRKVFFKDYNRMIKSGTKNDFNIEIETPVIHLSKKEIILKSIALKSPLHLTWSCYKRNDIACGVCDSCALRLRGFGQAGKIDPIKYKKIINFSL
ncbi:MAG TPA: 7-cyano-7-deazaguanine synthase QueC [Ignavibacteria bacterium]